MDTIVQTRPSRHIAPTSKLTDANNAALPELSFQRQAVQAFRTRAQEAPFDALIDTTAPPTRLSHKRSAAAIFDTDTEHIESGQDEDTDGKPKSRTFYVSVIKPSSLTLEPCHSQKATHDT
jgi:hypothetical protein